MNIWEILGIQPTQDKNEVADAYHKKLIENNPEDHPEEFKQLRAAYEEALNYCSKQDRSSMTKIELWRDQLDTLYNDFSKRIHPENWQKLLADELLTQPETKKQVEEELLAYLMEHNELGNSVMNVINDVFHFTERAEELCEQYPRRFVYSVLIDRVIYSELLRYEYFMPGVDEQECIAYADDYYNMKNAPLEELPNHFEKMLAHGEQNLYGKAFILMEKVRLGQKECLDELEALHNDYPTDYILISYLSVAYKLCDQPLKAEALDRDYLKSDENSPAGYAELVRTLKGQGKLIEAKKVIYAFLDNHYISTIGNWQQIINQYFQEINEAFIEQQQPLQQRDPENYTDKVELLWAYLQTNLIEKAQALYETIRPEEMDDYGWANIRSCLSFAQNDYESALKHTDDLIELAKATKDDGSAEMQRRIRRVPEFILRKANILASCKKQDEAISTCQKALSLNENYLEAKQYLAELWIAQKEYQKAREILEEIIAYQPQCCEAFYQLALVFMEIDDDQKAYNAIERASDLFINLRYLVLKLRLLIENHAEKPARELYEQLVSWGAGEHVAVRYCKARILELFDDKPEEALPLYEAMLKEFHQEEALGIEAIAYYRYVVLKSDEMDFGKPEDRDFLLEHVEKGLSYRSDHFGLRNFKAYVLRKGKRFEEALAIYNQLLTQPHPSSVEFGIAMIYYNDLTNNADKALEFFKKAYEKGETDALFYLSYSAWFLGQFEESRKYAQLLLETEEADHYQGPDSHYRLSYAYEGQKEYQQALKENNLAIQNARKNNIKLLKYYTHKVLLLRQMERPDEALATVQEMVDAKIIDDGNGQMAEICLQFGRYQEAYQYIHSALKKRKDADRLVPRLIDYYYLTGQPQKAKLAYLRYSALMNQGAKLQSQLAMAQCDLDHDKETQYALERLKLAKQEKDIQRIHWVHLAEACLFSGNRDEKLKAAQKALEYYNKEAVKFSTEKALNHVLMARILICLERYEEAEAELAKARGSSCANCHYCRCKDADTFEIYLLIAKKEYEKAHACCLEYKDKWPEEPYYDSLIRYLKKEKQK